MALPDYDPISTAGAGGLGGIVGYLVSYFKHKELKDEIDKRITEKSCETQRGALTQRFDDFSSRVGRIESKIDKLLEHSIKAERMKI